MEFLELLDPFQETVVPVGDWVQSGLSWVVENYRDVFQMIKTPVQIMLETFEQGLLATPALVMILIIGLIGWQVTTFRVALGAVACMTTIGLIGAWDAAMTTLAIVLTAVIFCVIIGLPLGMLAARHNRFEAMLRPVLDFMQTIPSFVYLVPVVMLFGVGNAAGVVVTIIYALAPLVRLTNLGLRQVRPDLVEASVAFGARPNQTLFKIQLPLALPTIMAGVNQTIMMALSMSVVASMISVTGLGQMVLRGIGRLDMSVASTGGLGIVLIAISIDRISQGFGLTRRDRGHRNWYQAGPVGVIVKLVTKA
jgi:glycine betaine/proline transport system permease protein